jgi:hypothetical protein
MHRNRKESGTIEISNASEMNIVILASVGKMN